VTTRDPNRSTNRASDISPAGGASYTAASGGAGQSTGDAVKEKASDALGTAQQAISQKAEEAKQKGMSQLAQRKSQAADSLTDVSQAVTQVGTQLRQSNHESLARYADMATEQVDRVASYLRGRDAGEILDEVQDFARRQPALILGGAFVLGVIGARFFKSSAPQSGGRGAPGYRSGRYGSADVYSQQYRYDYPRDGMTTREWRAETQSGRIP
jgi:hypothetical protein